MFFVWLKNDWREYYLNICIRYIMDRHHTHNTYQEEYKEQFKNMIEQIEQHIGMERGADILRCRMTKKLNSLKLLH